MFELSTARRRFPLRLLDAVWPGTAQRSEREGDAAAGVQGARDPSTGWRVRATVLLAGIWVLGLVALVAVIQFERRVDTTRHAQVVIAQMRNQQSVLLEIAFAPAIAGSSNALGNREQTLLQLAAGERKFSASVEYLADLGASAAPARIADLRDRYFPFVNELSALVARGAPTRAALELGQSERTGVIAQLTSELDRANASYGAEADHSRSVASIETIAAIISLLFAFSIAFAHSLRARSRSHREATTDGLTGLGNRRKLFADMKRTLSALDGKTTIAIGILDLDGFKAYNDTFGHPAGDALLTRLGSQLAKAIGDSGDAYRIGGDEFVVMTRSADWEALITSARQALSEQGDGFSVGCSVGSTQIHAGVTLDQALHIADQRLYTNKRVARAGRRSEVTDALLQVLAEQDNRLVTHLGHVAVLAKNTAIELGLSQEQVELTRLAAELHDIGKSAIPASILGKRGPLDPAERRFIERHSVIGERILAAALTLEAIAPIVRATHERPDGTGYPDGLLLDKIPICSRIIAVVDAYDAMTSDRAYRTAIPAAEALSEIRRHTGTQFDPTVVNAFVAALRLRPETAHAA